MGRFLGRRLALAVPTLIGVTIVVFITIKIIPGNPVATLAGINSTPAIRAALAHRLGLDSPFPVQYFDWLKSSLSGDFGMSISRQTAVRPLVFGAFGNTLILALAGFIFAIVGGVIVGGIGALWGRKAVGRAVSSTSVIAVSAPQYSVALVLLVLLSVEHPIFPSGGMADPTGGGGFFVLLNHLILPSIAAGIAPAGIVARMFRASLADVLGQEFITGLRSRGIGQVALLRHAIHNTLPTLFTIAGLQIGFLLGGVIFIETIFTWPGIGQLIYQSISSRDYPVIEASSLVIATAFVLVNLVIDAGHALVDPRGARMTIAEISAPQPFSPNVRKVVRSITGSFSRLGSLPPSVLISGGFITILIVAALFAPLVAPDGPLTGTVAERLEGLGAAGHLLGTDDQGRDILSRLIWGARPSLLEGIVPVICAGCIGGTLGIVAGLAKRRVHSLVMRTLDVLYSFPAILLAIALASALGAGTTSAIVALTIVLIAPIARVTDTEVARIKSTDFMEAAQASGASRPSIAFRQVVPVILPPLLVYCTALVGLAIVFAGGLSFLGLGIAPPAPEWGAMLNALANDLYDKPVLTLIPAIMIFVTSVAFNVLGDGLRSMLDVRRSGR